MSTPKVSILMNCYNSEEFLKESLDSVYNQSYQNFEVILVDNCSIDNTKKIASNYDERVRIFKTPENVPLYHARNFGLDKVDGQFLCILDSDDIWFPDKLEKQIKIMESQNIDFIFSKYRIKFESSSVFKRVLYFVYEYLKFTHLKSGKMNVSSIIGHYPINLQTVMIRWSKIKNERFNKKLSYVGDMDFFIRVMIKYDLKLYFLNSFTSISRIHQNQLSNESARRWLKEVRYLYFFTLGPYFNKSDKEKFKHELELKKYQILKSKKRYDQALKKLEPFKTYDLIHFYHYAHTYIQKIKNLIFANSKVVK